MTFKLSEPGNTRANPKRFTNVAKVALGKPADYGQELVKRRFRMTSALVSLQGKTVLDFGCGNGAQTIEFCRSGGDIIAVDLFDSSLKVFASHLAERGVSSTLPVQYDGGALPVGSGSMDIVMSYDVLEHVHDESLALTEMHRVLKPGGELVMSVPNKGWVFETHGAYLPLLPWNRVPFFSWLPRAIHSRYAKARIYRRKEIVRLLESHSFEVLGSQYMMAPMDVVRIPWLKRALRRLVFGRDTTRWTFLSTVVLVHARKA